MSNDYLFLEDLLRTADYWRPSHHGAYNAYVYQENEGYFQEHRVSPDLLHLYHPGLLPVLAAMTRWAGRKSGDFRAGGTEVKCNVAILRGETISLVDTAGRALLLACFDAPRIPAPLNLQDRVYIYGYHLNMHVIDIDGVDVPFVLEAKNWDWGVYRSEIDKCYPSWELKWVVARELGLDMDEQLRYMFSSASPDPIKLPDNLNLASS